ncbi:hypothetical protein [Alicyclobacillus sendaiensis]|uniref:hypothetical protein n=1 Tax=Alicyclobacillus sendaiensis TaxID=192387 RepID=UPI00078213B5|nr:hypothetical protein [Alicyclobacillus sendaiensis]
MNTSRWMARVLALSAAAVSTGSLVWASTAFADTVPHSHGTSAQAAASAQPTPNQPNFIFLPPWPDDDE